MGTDRFSTGIKCLNCGASGKARITEDDGWSYVRGSKGRHVDSVPRGFTVVNHGKDFGQDTIVHCQCGGTAVLAADDRGHFT